MMVFMHVFDLQILKHDRAEPIHQLPGDLMSKIELTARDPFVDACDNLSGFLTFRSLPIFLLFFRMKMTPDFHPVCL